MTTITPHNAVGMAGSASPRLAPQRRPAVHTTGPFRATLGATQAIHLTNEVPQELLLALLTKAPNLDGVNWIEVSAPDYERQSVSLIQQGMSYSANTVEVKFGLEEPAEGVTHIGLFKKDGTLAFYGTLVGMGYGPNPPSDFVFPAASLRCKTYGMKIVAG